MSKAPFTSDLSRRRFCFSSSCRTVALVVLCHFEHAIQVRLSLQSIVHKP
ncbi:hypothetical protein HYC85_012508 [Camellia sinensis]|uniref:Uncharacterized protein n=1 Tax=Camellia sinensis TaxID=4442 RepID=A0A7J7HD16_CAMSI|nr:hypothetical protein HYC85_012508 [Camellia sinensis]